MPADRTYYVTTNPQKTALHTGRDCDMLSNARGVREAREKDRRVGHVCKICRGNPNRYTEGQKDHYQSLREAANAD